MRTVKYLPWFFLTCVAARAQILQTIAAGAPPAAVVGNADCTPAASYAHCRVLTINGGMVGGATLNNFPVLVQATLGASRIQSANCYDVIFTSDAGGMTQIPWQQSACAQSTGDISDWVLMAAISASGSTVFYMSYGNAAIGSPQNTGAAGPSNVWNSNFKGVWHLDEPLVGNGAKLWDSTSNANNCTVGGAMFVSLTGQVDNGVNPRLTGGISNLTSTITFPAGTAWGASWWIQAAASLNDSAVVGSTTDYSYIRAADGGGNVVLRAADGSYVQVSLGAFVPGTWYNFAVEVTAGGTVAVFKNGISIGGGAISGSITASGLFGNNFGTYSFLELDELRLYTGNHGAGWIAGEYNNQQQPGDFLTVGAES